MINELIDLYFYIKQHSFLNELKDYHYVVHNDVSCYVVLSPLMNPNSGKLLFRLKISYGVIGNYKAIELLDDGSIGLYDTNNFNDRIMFNGEFDEHIQSRLLKYITIDEINICKEIYKEMKTISDREIIYD